MNVLHKKIVYAMDSENAYQNQVLQSFIEKLGELEEVDVEIDTTDTKCVEVTVSFYTDKLTGAGRAALDTAQKYLAKVQAIEVTS